MTQKEYLSRGFEADIKIKSCLGYISELKERTVKVNSPISAIRGNGCNNKSHHEEILIKIMELEREVEEEINRLVTLKKEIAEAIDKISKPKERAVLSMRYLYMMRWEDIADTLLCSKRYVYILHKNALKKIRVPQDNS